jgi:hypothetical protein
MKTIATAAVVVITTFLFACNEMATNEKGVDSIKLASEDKTKILDSAAAMKAWMNFSTPGAMHKLLASANGQWKGNITMWEKPGAPPQKSIGSCVNSMILGGRYQQSVNKGNMMGMPFEGMSIVGYDNGRKEFVSNWIDNFGTGVMQMSGTYDSTTKTIHFKGTTTDPITGKPTNVKEDFTFNEDGSQLMEMYGSQTAGSPEFKMMEIKFTKK